MKRTPALLLSSMVTLVACTTPGARPDRPVTAAERGTLAMEVVAWSAATGPRPLVPGSELRSSDRFAITVLASKPLFLYIAQRSASGAPAILLPAGDAQPPRAEPDRPLRLPDDEKQGFQLGGKSADETLLVLASTRQLAPGRATQLLSTRADRPEPLRSGGATASREVAAAGGPGREGSDDTTAVREPPPILGDQRGPNSREAPRAQGRVHSELDNEGLALLSFPLRREP